MIRVSQLIPGTQELLEGTVLNMFMSLGFLWMSLKDVKEIVRYTNKELKGTFSFQTYQAVLSVFL